MLIECSNYVKEMLWNVMFFYDWRIFVECLGVLIILVVGVNLVFSYCGGLFGIVEFFLVLIDNVFFVVDFIIVFSFIWVLLF